MKEFRALGKSIFGVAVLLGLVMGMGPAVALHAQVNAVYLNANIGTVSNANVVLGYSNDGNGNLTTARQRKIDQLPRNPGSIRAGEEAGARRGGLG